MVCVWAFTISLFKNVYWSNLCVEFSFQVLDILQYASQGHSFQGAYGLKRGPALILKQDPVFEMAYKKGIYFYYTKGLQECPESFPYFFFCSSDTGTETARNRMRVTTCPFYEHAFFDV